MLQKLVLVRTRILLSRAEPYSQRHATRIIYEVRNRHGLNTIYPLNPKMCLIGEKCPTNICWLMGWDSRKFNGDQTLQSRPKIGNVLQGYSENRRRAYFIREKGNAHAPTGFCPCAGKKLKPAGPPTPDTAW